MRYRMVARIVHAHPSCQRQAILQVGVDGGEFPRLRPLRRLNAAKQPRG